MNNKILVAYFSASGVTKKAGETLSNLIKADLFEIQPQKPYTEEDLVWTDKNSRSSVEMSNSSSRPAIADKINQLDDYETIFIGFPIWWYVAPRIINTFLESYNFSGKTVIPFATSGGSGIEKAESDLHKCYPDITNWKKGKRLNGNIAEIKSWLDTLGY